MVTAAKISADLLANDAQFTEGFNRAATAVGRFAQSAQKDIKKISHQFDELIGSITGISGALGTIASVGGIVLLAKSALEAADSIEKLAQKLGLTTDEIQKYEYAAKQSNIPNEDLQAGFNNLNKLIAEGKVPYKNLNQAIGDIANRMANAADGSQRAKLAFDAFGKIGVNLIPMFLNGAAGLKAYGDEAERLGAVLPQETIERAAKFKSEIDTLGTVIVKNFQSGLLREFVDDSGKLRDIYSDPAFIEGVNTLGRAFGLAAKGAVAIVSAYQKASTIVAEFGIATGTDLGLVDPDVYAASLQEASDRLNPKKATSPLKLTIPRTPSGSIRLDEKVPPESQLAKYTAALNSETAAIGLSERALFTQKAVIQAQNAARTDYEQHLRTSPKLTDEETASISESAKKFYDLRAAQQQAERYNEQFKAGFEDAAASIVNGSKSISDAIKDLVVQFAALIEKQLILQPLADSIFGAKGTTGAGGGIGGLLAGAAGAAGFFGSQGGAARLLQTGSSSFIGPLPSFDSGIDRVPSDMTANIHRNEAVLNPQDAEDWRNGKSGDTYMIDATGASASKLTELKALIISLAGPGRVEERVRDARRRGQNI